MRERSPEGAFPGPRSPRHYRSAAGAAETPSGFWGKNISSVLRQYIKTGTRPGHRPGGPPPRGLPRRGAYLPLTSNPPSTRPSRWAT